MLIGMLQKEIGDIECNRFMKSFKLHRIIESPT